MARTRAMILTTIWSDPDFLRLAPAEKLLYLTLISQPDINHLGVLTLARRRWARAIGVDSGVVMASLVGLEAARFVVLDTDAEQVMIRSFLRNDGVARQPNMLRSAASALATVMSSAILSAIDVELTRIEDEDATDATRPILAEMRVQVKTLREGFPDGFAEPFGEGFEVTTKKGSTNPSGKALGDRGSTSGSAELAVARAHAPAREDAEPKAARATRLPEPFPITPEMVAWCVEACPGLDGRRETERFVDYWRAAPGTSGRKLDWVATWRNWMRKAHEQRPASRGGSVEVKSTTDARVAAAIEAGARVQQMIEEGSA